MKSKENPTKGKKKKVSQIENVVRAIIKYNEFNKIYNSCYFQSRQMIAIKNNIICCIECPFINVIFVFFLLLLFFLFSFSTFVSLYRTYFFFEFGSLWSQLWPVFFYTLPITYVKILKIKNHLQSSAIFQLRSILVKIFRNFRVFYYRSSLSQVKQNLIYSTTNFAFKLPNHLEN